MGDEFNGPSFSLTKVKHSFSVYGRREDQFIMFTLDQLPVALRIGDEVLLPYFRAWLDENSFYVENVEHYFKDGEQEVHYLLRRGRFSPYMYFRKDQAIEEEEIGWEDYYRLSSWELKRKLRIGRRRSLINWEDVED